MSQLSLFLKVASTPSSLKRGGMTSLIVGTILNLINVDFSDPHIPKALLTYCVPFLVSVYSSTAARLRFDPGLQAPTSVQLHCKACASHSTEVIENSIIPECPNCKDHTEWKPTKLI